MSKAFLDNVLAASEQMVINNAAEKFRRKVDRREYVSVLGDYRKYAAGKLSGFIFFVNREYGPNPGQESIERKDVDRLIQNNAITLNTWFFFRKRQESVSLEDATKIHREINEKSMIGELGYNFLVHPSNLTDPNIRDFADGIRLSEFLMKGNVLSYKGVLDLGYKKMEISLGSIDSKSIYSNLNRANKVKLQIIGGGKDLLIPVDEKFEKDGVGLLSLNKKLIELLLPILAGTELGADEKVIDYEVRDINKIILMNERSEEVKILV